jgi:hypothetical protein
MRAAMPSAARSLRARIRRLQNAVYKVFIAKIEACRNIQSKVVIVCPRALGIAGTGLLETASTTWPDASDRRRE